MPQGMTTKCQAVYESPFWREDGLSGEAVSERGPIGVIFDNSPPDNPDGGSGSFGVLVGFMTHMCVSATVRCATDNGFMSTIAADTVATRDLPDATGGATVTADAINRITLAALSDRFAWIVPKAAQIR